MHVNFYIKPQTKTSNTLSKIKHSGQLLKLLKIILRDAEKSGLEVHPYANYIESFKQKSSDRILHVLNPLEIKVLKELQ